MAGRRLEATFHIVIGQIAPLQNIKRCVEGAGLKLAGVCLQPMASADAVLSSDEKEAGVVMTGAGATFPYGKDPKDSNLRIAPTYPTDAEIETATAILTVAVRLAALEKIMG